MTTNQKQQFGEMLAKHESGEITLTQGERQQVQAKMTTANQFSLDVDAPDQVASVLRETAQAYYESAGELESAWQDRNAGKPWERIARILESAALKIERAV